MFTTAYCRAHPQQFANLLKYADIIRELFNTRARWAYYDKHFRKTRETVLLPWEQLQMELWGKAMVLFRDCEDEKSDRFVNTNQSGRQQQQQRRHSGPSPRPAVPGQSQTAGGNTPTGYCYPYHQGDRCSGTCGYDHSCHVCNDDHRAMYCPKRPSVGRHKVKGKSRRASDPGKRK